jgi:tetratricopeptide (TPR) repeat protein
MKRIVFAFALFWSLTGLAQNSDIQIEKQKLKQALAYGDKNIAASVMYNIIALEGPQSTYKDSLAYMYFNVRNYVSCFLVINDILENRPDNMDLIEMKAVSLETIGAFDKAIESYENLLSKSNSNYHAYKIAALKMGLKKFDEALVAIKNADALPDDGKLQVNFQVNQNYNQNVPLKAAIPYIEGLISINLNKEKEARESFNRAIAVFPDFVLAKSKLEVLKVPEKEN